MKVVKIVAGVFIMLMGAVWIGQGLNLIPGSFMTGQVFWAWMGLACVVAGVGLIVLGLRGRAAR